MQEQNPILSFLMLKRWFYVRHFLFFLALALVYNLFSPASIALYAEKVNVPVKVFYIGQTLDMIFSLFIIYFNLYFLFPRYFKKALYLKYSFGILFSSVLFFLCSYFIQRIYVIYFGKIEKYAVHFTFDDFINTVVFPIVFLSATTGYKVFKEWIHDQKRFAELEKEKINAELLQLKTQVNPHFLFNTLNNLNVLIQTNPEKASDIVLGLSDVLRFQIYDSQHDLVLLTKDIEIIMQYIELEQIRRDNLKVKIETFGKISGILIPPLLFINFVDNAVKHSYGREDSFINISFEVIENELLFVISNSRAIHSKNAFNENGGLGLPNIKKRLNLLYGKRYSLTITDKSDSFTVKLRIPLS